MDEEAMAYFKKSAIEYSKGDVRELLEKKIDCAGPLLAVVVNGIDNLGGMCYGFEIGSKRRSVNFMKDKMGILESVAKFLYSAVRCGEVHQGMPKIGLKFFVTQDRLAKGKMIYKHKDSKYLFLDLTEFAYSYIDAIDQIENKPEERIHNYPSPGAEAKELFDNAMRDIKDDIQDLIDVIFRKRETEAMKKAGREPLAEWGSSAAYTPDNTLNITIDLPPRN